MQKSRTVNAKLNTVWGIVNKVITLFFPFIVRTVFIYKLGTDFLGLDSLFISILQVLSLSELGFSDAIVYSLYKPIANKDTNIVCALLYLIKKVYIIVGIVILAVGLSFLPFLPMLIKGTIPAGINLYLLYIITLSNTVISYFLSAYKNVLFIASQESRIQLNINSITSFFKSVIQLLLLLSFANYYLYLIVVPVITIINNIFIMIESKKRYPDYSPKGDVPKNVKDEIRKNTSGMLISKICNVTRNSLDSIVISSLIGLTSVALYNNYFLIMSSIHAMLGVFITALRGSIGNIAATENRTIVHENMLKINFLYILITSFCFTCLICLYQPFMVLWLGTQYLLPNYIMYAFCIYFFQQCAGDIISLYSDAYGIFYQLRWKSIFETITNLILNILLGKYFGVMGIVCATIISIFIFSQIIANILIYKNCFPEIKITKYYLLSLLYFVIAIIITVVLFIFCNVITKITLIGFIEKAAICIIGAGILYFLIYSRTSYFKYGVGVFIKK